MKRPGGLIDRSFDMMIASYYLSRCGERLGTAPSAPPAALGVKSWAAAYTLFFDAMGDGRTPSQFRNSLKNARDTFDTIFDNGRIGWVDRDGRQPSLSPSFRRIHDEWKERSDAELESFILRLITGDADLLPEGMAGVQARTEGGKKVFISVRRERDPKLRQEAISIHGLNCMACGFNFERTYGAIGSDFIEVHHITPLSEAGLTETNPKTDLAVLCSNCHRMVHRSKEICLTLDEIKKHLRK